MGERRDRKAILAAALAAVALLLWWLLRSGGDAPIPPPPAPPTAPTPPRVPSPAPAPAPAPPVLAPAAAAAGPGTSEEEPFEPPPPEGTTRLRVVVRSKPEGKPLAGAEVSVRPKGGAEILLRTGEDGSVRHEGLPPGWTNVVVRAPGRIRAEDGGELVSGGVLGISIEMEEGTSLPGRVLDADTGQPLAGARVLAYPGGSLTTATGSESYSTGAGPFGETVTDAEGRFRLDGLSLQEILTVQASARGHAPARQCLRLGAGDAEAREVVLRLEAAASLRGTVKFPDGRPAGGATVIVGPADEEDLLSYEDFMVVGGDESHRALRATAGAEGEYEVDGLAPGQAYAALAALEGWGASPKEEGILCDRAGGIAARDFVLVAPVSLRVRLLLPDGTPAKGAAVRVVRAGEAARDLTGDGTIEVAGLPPGKVNLSATLAGFPKESRDLDLAPGKDAEEEIRFVAGVAISGVLVDDAGKPVAAATVFASMQGHEDGDAGESHGTAATDAAGRFRIEGLRAGIHEVGTSADGYSGTTSGPVTAPAEGAKVVVARGARYRGRLVLPSGAAAPANWTLGVTERHEDGSTGSYGEEEWGDGTFEKGGLSAGVKEIEVMVAGYVTVIRKVTLLPGETADLGEFNLDPGLDLEGRVVDAAGKPLPGVMVSCGESFGPTHQVVSTDREGRFVLHHLAAGENRISASAQGFLPAAKGATLPLASPFAIALHAPTALLVTLRSAGGALPEGLRARWAPTDGRTSGEGGGKSDAKGEIRGTLAPGKYVLEVRPFGSEDVIVTREFTLVEGTPLAIEVEVPAR